MVTRHSKQMPIPQSGARGWPVTERRYVVMPASAIAVETGVPSATVTGIPLTVTRTEVSGMRGRSRRQIWIRRDRRHAALDVIRDQASGPQRSRNAETFVPGSQQQSLILWARADERQFVRSGCAEAGPAADRD